MNYSSGAWEQAAAEAERLVILVDDLDQGWLVRAFTWWRSTSRPGAANGTALQITLTQPLPTWGRAGTG